VQVFKEDQDHVMVQAIEKAPHGVFSTNFIEEVNVMGPDAHIYYII